jgi:predicted nucleic acid-binding protein
MGGELFADTFYWIALTYRRDAWRRRVVSWHQSHPAARLVTTEEVMTEALAWFAPLGPTWRRIAAQMVERTLVNAAHRVLPQTSADFRDALNLYQSRLDKEYSLVDCRSMVAMRSLHLTEVLSNDHHFTQEGFTIVFS